MSFAPSPHRSRAMLTLGLCPRPVAALALIGALGLLSCGTSAAGTMSVTGPAGAALIIDGRSFGALPLPDPITLEPGSHVVCCRLRGYRAFEKRVKVAATPGSLIVNATLQPLSRGTALVSGVVFAGLGQQYVGRPRLGWVLTAFEAGGLAAGIVGETSLRSRRDDYTTLYKAYQSALTEADIAAKKAAADKAWGKVQDAADLRETGLIVAAGAVVVGVLDAWLRFPGVEAGPGTAPPAAGGAPATVPHEAAGAPSLHLAYTARF